MTLALRHIRSLLIALVALALSAGLALGAQAPQAASFGLAKAASLVGQNAGSGDEVTTTEDTETPEPDETTEDTSSSADNCTTDPTDPATDLTTLTHGQIVCWAAHQPTPDGYANHGAWVSSWAKGNHGQNASTKSNGKANGHSSQP
jgi:type II secretory pathway pseudopilin PulG